MMDMRLVGLRPAFAAGIPRTQEQATQRA
jgi:hypothetical protein